MDVAFQPRTWTPTVLQEGNTLCQLHQPDLTHAWVGRSDCPEHRMMNEDSNSKAEFLEAFPSLCHKESKAWAFCHHGSSGMCPLPSPSTMVYPQGYRSPQEDMKGFSYSRSLPTPMNLESRVISLTPSGKWIN